MSWKRNAQPTGSCQRSAKRSSAAQAARVPAAAAGDDERPLGGEQTLAQRRAWPSGAGAASAGSTRGSTGAEVIALSMSSGSASTTGPGPALHRGMEGARDVLRQPVRIVHLAHPLGEAQRSGSEHLPVVDLLERLAIALVAGDLADEQDHRRRVLERRVQADRGVARAGPARHEADARPAGQLALRLGHEAGAALVAAADEADASGCSKKPSSAAR